MRILWLNWWIEKNCLPSRFWCVVARPSVLRITGYFITSFDSFSRFTSNGVVSHYYLITLSLSLALSVSFTLRNCSLAALAKPSKTHKLCSCRFCSLVFITRSFEEIKKHVESIKQFSRLLDVELFGCVNWLVSFIIVFVCLCMCARVFPNYYNNISIIIELYRKCFISKSQQFNWIGPVSCRAIID